MNPVLVSPHNPMSGARHLGHYVSTMMEWTKLQDDYECYFVVDDLVAYFIHPGERSKLQNRSMFVLRDFLASGVDPKKANLVLTSLLPENLELMTLLSAYVDLPYAERLFKQSYCGLLPTYHRAQVGLPQHPSLAEFVYPPLGTPSLLFGLGARYLQGGEEMLGYKYIGDAIAESYNRAHGKGLQAPEFMGAKTPFLVGVDGNHMSIGNEVSLASPPAEIREAVSRIQNASIAAGWYQALGETARYQQLNRNHANLDTVREELADYLIQRFEKVRKFRGTNQELLDAAMAGTRKAAARIRRTTARIKRDLGISVEAEPLTALAA